MEQPVELRDALEGAVAGIPVRELAAAVERLSSQYRAGGEPAQPILRTRGDVAAYAAYRMPATFAAVRSALTQVAAASPDLRPESLLDIGGGTGAAGWAATGVFGSLRTVTVIDQVAEALALGGQLVRRAAAPALPGATWIQAGVGSAFPGADLATASYLLGELSEADQEAVVRRAAQAAPAVVLVEPGTPAGYQRILAARAVLIDSGLTIAAPCPHQNDCPIVPGQDWCHFGVRVNRSALHRRIKQAELGYEDEKFSYVAAVRAPVTPPAGRVLRRPQLRKGLVTLHVCDQEKLVGPRPVSKRQGDVYRAAREIEWGGGWPPAVAGAEEGDRRR